MSFELKPSFCPLEITGPSGKDIESKSIDEKLMTIDENVSILKQLNTSVQEGKELSHLTKQVQEYAELIKRMSLVKSMSGDIDERSMEIMNSSRDSIFNLTTEFINEQEAIMDQTMKNTLERLHLVIKLGIASIIIGLFIGAVLSIWSIRAIRSA